MGRYRLPLLAFVKLLIASTALPQLARADEPFNVQERAALCEWLGQQAGVAEEKRLTPPAVFVVDEALVGDDLSLDRLEALLARHVEAGAEPLWEKWTSSQGQAASSIMERFRAFSLPTILAAGLVDGLNPLGLPADHSLPLGRTQASRSGQALPGRL